jgi:hypothetical protein
MTAQNRIPVEIKRITDPGGSIRLGAVTYLSEVLSTPDVRTRLENIEKQYAILLKTCSELLKHIRSPEGRANAALHWRIADAINNFWRSTPRISGAVVVNLVEALNRDLSVSETQLHYLQRFYRAYPNLSDLDSKINWSKYRELMDFPDAGSRKKCEMLIIQGKIGSDKEIRQFKKEIKSAQK